VGHRRALHREFARRIKCAGQLGSRHYFPLRAAEAFDGGVVPAYYVAVDGRLAEVGATATGAVLAAIRTPTPTAGYFEYVSGAADDRTFVLAAVRRLRTELYLLRLDPHARTATLSPLPFTVAIGADLQFAGLALSPDGRKLAVAVNNWAADSVSGARLGLRPGYRIPPGTGLAGGGTDDLHGRQGPGIPVVDRERQDSCLRHNQQDRRTPPSGQAGGQWT